MTRDELNELKMVVRRAIEEEREMYDEVWLTEKELIAQFGIFTHDWVKKYGQCLQPARAIVVDEHGVEHRRVNPEALISQKWRKTDDCIFHEGGLL